jgi:hemoglobin
MTDIQNNDDIKLLVDGFYKKVIHDELIGKFFTEVVQLNFEAHMPTMYAFWGNVLFASGAYKGNPMIKHMALSQKESLQPAHFQQWLLLWTETVDQLFVGKKADEAKLKANQIAQLMQQKIGLMT